jgi:hypothetical protein
MLRRAGRIVWRGRSNRKIRDLSSAYSVKREVNCVCCIEPPDYAAEERFVFGEYDTIATVGPSLSINTDARYWNCNNPRHL